jgi:AbrB family looped-hinge helix DNA binding protein
MRITSKGKVTIPARIRERAGLLPGTEVDFELDGEVVQIVRAKSGRGKTRGEQAVALLRAHPGDIKMSTEEIMALMRGD